MPQLVQCSAPKFHKITSTVFRRIQLGELAKLVVRLGKVVQERDRFQLGKHFAVPPRADSSTKVAVIRSTIN